MNAIEIPGPLCCIVVKGEHSLVGERINELNGEEGIATGLLAHQLRKRRAPLRLATKGVGNQLPEMLAGQGPKRDLLYLSSSALDGTELLHQRMSSSDFIVPVSTDQQEVP